MSLNGSSGSASTDEGATTAMPMHGGRVTTVITHRKLEVCDMLLEHCLQLTMEHARNFSFGTDEMIHDSQQITNSSTACVDCSNARLGI